MDRLTRGHYVACDGNQRKSWSLMAVAVLDAKSARTSGRKASPRPDGYDARVPFDDEISSNHCRHNPPVTLMQGAKHAS